jgi:hypothetical protein
MSTKKNTKEIITLNTGIPQDRIKAAGFYESLEIASILQAAKMLNGNLNGNIDLVVSLIRPSTAEVVQRAEDIMRRY